MIKLYEGLPQGVTVDGRFYRLNLGFKNVLKMLEILDDENLTITARDYLALKCVLSRPRNVNKVLPAVKALLFEKRPQTGEKLTSFEQDAGLIRTAFLQEYKIDLFRENIHWLQFIELLQNLPGGNRYEEILGIRARPIPEATKYNQKEREWLIKAKGQVALQMTEKEREEKYSRDVLNVFSGLMALIPKEEVRNNAE